MRAVIRDERGIVSIVAVIFISILLSIITVGMVRLTTTETRLSTDFLLSTKAGYAAEVGIEDALFRMRRTGPFNQTSCNPSVDVEATVAAYTCQLVDTVSSEFTDKIRPSQALQIDLSDGTFSQLRLEWYRKNFDENNGGYTEYPSTHPGTAPSTMLPLLRAELIRYPKGGFNRTGIEQAVFFLKPNFAGSTTSAADNFTNYNSSASTAKLLSAHCSQPLTTNDGDYACDFTLSGLNTAAFNYMLRASTYYERAPISFRLEKRDSSGLPQPQNNLMATLDVTARANDVFRRVRYRVPLLGTARLPLYALGASGSICKDLEVSTVNSEQVKKGGEDGCSRTADPQ